MKITYRELNTNGDVIQTLGKKNLKNFGTKIKIVKATKWLQEEADLLGKFAKEIEDEFDIRNKFEFDADGNFSGTNKEELIKAVNAKRGREDELFAQEIDLVEVTFDESELEDSDLTADELLKLANLKLFTI